MFADQLEERQNTPQGTDYLKMALKLWHKILEQAQENNVYMKLGLGGDYMAQIPNQMRQQIVAKIQQLNDLVQKRDPDFIPDQMPEQPLQIPAGIKAAAGIGCISLLVLFSWVMIAYPSASKQVGKMVDYLMFFSDFGTDSDTVRLILFFIYFGIISLIYKRIVKGKLFPIIYHYFSTKN